MNLKIRYTDSLREVTFSHRTFSGGEPHFEFFSDVIERDVDIHTRIKSFNDLGDLLVATDALRRRGVSGISLTLPYFPGARQDRPFPKGAFTLKVYADIINAQGYDRVRILDPHSLVTPALVNNVQLMNFEWMAVEFLGSWSLDPNAHLTGVICPDAGAMKRVESIVKLLPRKPKVIQATKVRNESTGEITGVTLPLNPYDRFTGRWAIIDDICDGGATFVGLAREWAANKLEFNNALHPSYKPTLDLWVTHGIFSCGLDGLFKLFSRIGTTDSFFSATPQLRELWGSRLVVKEIQ